MDANIIENYDGESEYESCKENSMEEISLCLNSQSAKKSSASIVEHVKLPGSKTSISSHRPTNNHRQRIRKPSDAYNARNIDDDEESLNSHTSLFINSENGDTAVGSAFAGCVGSFEWGYPESSPEKRFQNVKLRELPNSYQQKEEKTDENCRPNRDGILKHGLITRRYNQDMESSQRASTQKSKVLSSPSSVASSMIVECISVNDNVDNNDIFHSTSKQRTDPSSQIYPKRLIKSRSHHAALSTKGTKLLSESKLKSRRFSKSARRNEITTNPDSTEQLYSGVGKITGLSVHIPKMSRSISLCTLDQSITSNKRKMELQNIALENCKVTATQNPSLDQIVTKKQIQITETEHETVVTSRKKAIRFCIKYLLSRLQRKSAVNAKHDTLPFDIDKVIIRMAREFMLFIFVLFLAYVGFSFYSVKSSSTTKYVYSMKSNAYVGGQCQNQLVGQSPYVTQKLNYLVYKNEVHFYAGIITTKMKEIAIEMKKSINALSQRISTKIYNVYD